MDQCKKDSEEFDYFSLWNKQEKKESEKLEKDLPIGKPRKGIKGKYIKVKGYVSKKRIGYSYGRFVKEEKREGCLKNIINNI